MTTLGACFASRVGFASCRSSVASHEACACDSLPGLPRPEALWLHTGLSLAIPCLLYLAQKLCGFTRGFRLRFLACFTSPRSSVASHGAFSCFLLLALPRPEALWLHTRLSLAIPCLVCLAQKLRGFTRGFFLLSLACFTSPRSSVASQGACCGKTAVAEQQTPYTTISAGVMRATVMRSAGASSIWKPTLPALTKILSSVGAVSWMNVGKGFFMPMGEQPPWT